MSNRAATALLAATAAGCLLASCSSADSSTAAPAPAAATADQVIGTLAAKIPTVKLVKTYTAEDDRNHLLGRPNGYTSRSAFSDSRVPADQLNGVAPDDTDRGGSVEVFPDEAGAKGRADYIQAVTKSFPAAAEYDYVAGPVLVRVSHLLTPDQAKEYQAAVK